MEFEKIKPISHSNVSCHLFALHSFDIPLKATNDDQQLILRTISLKQMLPQPQVIRTKT